MGNSGNSVAGSTLDTPLWVIVPAAGSGRRLGGEVAKQYQLLDGMSMLERTIKCMLDVPGVEGLVAVLAENDERWAQLERVADPRILATVGGETRADSVLAGIRPVLLHAKPDTWVMVHDAARPLVAKTDIQRLINTIYNAGAVGGLLATPVHDTLKKTDDYGCVMQTVARQGLWQAQTPQLFRVGALSDALTHAVNLDADAVTDEASAMELAGHQPQLVEALQPNFKITRPVDLQLARALLQEHRQ